MARIARVVVPDLPHHVTQRGNRREPVFFEGDDYRLYRRLVTAAARARRYSSLGLLPNAQSRPPANHAHLA
jgi:REP-associated tyrosine transposase